ncbi:hypothetical protein G9A89_002596 [Geosiphon pyriformis]|nr:hypothetical protein G9A89_002596 [Geosiphon pyriformis]
MEYKEINRYRPYVQDCNECKRCQRSIKNNKDYNLCAACWFIFFEKHYKDFSSGNKVVDEITKNPNNDNRVFNYYEWIPWERLSNINKIAQGGFGIIYKATLIDRLLDPWNIKHHGEMEYKRERIGTEVAIKIIKTNTYGLSSIHDSGMVHRDLHSGNIIQYNERWVDIGDLGLCQPINNKATTTEEKKIYGVIPYIPPEVLRGEKFTTAGDIYSFSMLLWELATGKPPFHDCSHDAILIMAILNGQRPEITSPLIPPCIAEIIVKCWDVNPENRPTAREVVNKLEKLVANDSTTKPLGRFSKYIQFLKKAKKRDEIAKPSTTTKINIHRGAVYTSRLLTAQMVDFSKG